MTYMIKIQALRGVSAESPANTLYSLRYAVAQGYDAVRIDVAATADGVLVMHGGSLENARDKDGERVKARDIGEISFEQAKEYDYGVYFLRKFKGAKLTPLKEALDYLSENGVMANISSSFESLPDEAKTSLFALVSDYGNVAFTASSIASLKELSEKTNAELHIFTGKEVDAPLLSSIRGLGIDKKITVWLIDDDADTETCALIRENFILGLAEVDDYNDFARAERLCADIIETFGRVKHDKNVGVIADMHSHTKNSHDAVSDPDELCRTNIERGVSYCTFTDHIDICLYGQMNLYANIISSYKDAMVMREKYKDKIKVLAGVEPGEAIWRMYIVDELLELMDFDVVLGSVHTLRHKKDIRPFASIDFTDWTHEELLGYVDLYFDELWETVTTMPCDIMTHLTVILRYVNGRYRKNIDISLYDEKIKKILRFVIDHGIPMEVNTSGIGGPFSVLLPDRKYLEMYRDMGGYMITLGSDAHAAEKAANAFPETIALLKELGFKHIYKVEKRIPVQCTLV